MFGISHSNSLCCQFRASFYQIAKPDTQLKLIPFQLNKPLKLRLQNFSVVNFPLKLLHQPRHFIREITAFIHAV